MKKIDLKPTNENVLNMLEMDYVSRNENIRNFIEIIDYLDENTSISINGDWGTGKTFFVKQVIQILKYKNELIRDKNEENNEKIKSILVNPSCKLNDLEITNKFVPIYYNAWDNDSHNDPLLSIIYNIVKEGKIDGYGKISKTTFEKIASIADIFNIWSTGSLTKCAETFKSEDITDEIITIENAKEILRELLNESLVEKGTKLIVFIDELDRCNPTYAVKLLERIKHFIEDDRVIFVFSTNIIQLSNTISNYYGANFDSFKYMSKFFDISFDLNAVDSSKYIEFLGLKKSWLHFDTIIHNLSCYYNFSMRENNRYIQSINIVRDYVNIERNGFSDSKGYQFLLIVMVPILLALKIADIKEFINVINGNRYSTIEALFFEVDEIKTVLKKCCSTSSEEEKKEINDEELKIILFEIYNVIFNNVGDKTYSNGYMSFDNKSKKDLMDVVSLLKKELKYK